MRNAECGMRSAESSRRGRVSLCSIDRDFRRVVAPEPCLGRACLSPSSGLTNAPDNAGVSLSFALGGRVNAPDNAGVSLSFALGGRVNAPDNAGALQVRETRSRRHYSQTVEVDK